MKGSKLLIATTTIATCFGYYYTNKTVYDNSKLELQRVYGYERQMDERAYALTKVKVVEVLEGDIIKVDNKGMIEKVRLIGLDSPNIEKNIKNTISIYKDEDYYLTNQELLEKYNLKEEDIPLDLNTTSIAAYIKEQILNETFSPPEDILKESNKDEFKGNPLDDVNILNNMKLTNEEKELLKLFYKLKNGNMAEEAREYTSKLLLNKEVYIMNDIQSVDEDSLGRSLKYVFLEKPLLEETNEELKKKLVNYKIIENGYGIATNYGNPKQYGDDLKLAQKKAKENKKGLWDLDNYYNTINTSILEKEGKKPKEIKDILDKYKQYLNGTLFEDSNGNRDSNNKDTNDKLSDKNDNKENDNKENNEEKTNKTENN